ncbi:sugar ABC transporter permease [Streptacidiphilus sp. N1-3]|uniref:Xylose transport system permease protein XylH n=1 Tax=Streptacidiphilus alkalitolerans TaxID=3342712 RepID=A0ABV6X2P6_9ACTN
MSGTRLDPPAVDESDGGVPGAVVPDGVAEHLRAYLRQLRNGEMGALPALGGLVVLCVAFSIMRPDFLSAGNFANLFTQGAAVTAIAMGLVFVLLLGEIDLSAGFTSGVCAALMGTLLSEHGTPWWLAVPAALAAGALIGAFLGVAVAKIGIPSFVITLAAFLALQGVVLIIIGSGGNVAIRDSTVTAIDNDNLSPAVGWALLAVALAGYAAVRLATRRGRQAKGLPLEPLALAGLRVAVFAALGAGAVYALNLERSRNPALVSLRGVPIVVPILAGLLVVWTYVLSSTAYGRHIYAVGGNAEAARRGGVKVSRVRISAFVVCSTMAAVGGVIAASRATSVDPNAGGSNTLLYAVGAAVIGGTSLFGGKGRVADAVLGGAVVAVIDNGMGLMGYSAGVKFVVTGSVLALAAGVDALSRKRSAGAGGG